MPESMPILPVLLCVSLALAVPLLFLLSKVFGKKKLDDIPAFDPPKPTLSPPPNPEPVPRPRGLGATSVGPGQPPPFDRTGKTPSKVIAATSRPPLATAPTPTGLSESRDPAVVRQTTPARAPAQVGRPARARPVTQTDRPSGRRSSGPATPAASTDDGGWDPIRFDDWEGHKPAIPSVIHESAPAPAPSHSPSHDSSANYSHATSHYDSGYSHDTTSTSSTSDSSPSCDSGSGSCGTD